MRHFSRPTIFLLLGAVLNLGACKALVDTSNEAASITKQAFADTRDTWRDVFTYRSPAKPQLPQTRYCYQMQSDVVCYDSVQTQLTSKLVGYQDGDSISWVQPGGGSLGASGAEPVAFRLTQDIKAAPMTHADMPVQGQIQSHSLPPR